MALKWFAFEKACMDLIDHTCIKFTMSLAASSPQYTISFVFCRFKTILLLVKSVYANDKFDSNVTLNGMSFEWNIEVNANGGIFISIRLTRRMDMIFCGQLSNKLLEKGHIKERLKNSRRKFYGRHGDLIKQNEVPFSRRLNRIMQPDHIQWHPPPIKIYLHSFPYDWTWPFTKLGEVTKDNLRRVNHADRRCSLLGIPGPVPFGLFGFT